MAFNDSKQHYALLDGLRGVASFLVVWYHIFEGYAFASGSMITMVNHGYLAVDFFFMLSGFVISYAYDDRWNKTIDYKGFFKRRLIRLHPMVVLGAIIGAITFAIQGFTRWDGSHVAISSVMLALLCAMFLIPATPGSCYDVRGNGEMYSLNGPTWSLIFEYIANVLYAIALRRVGRITLCVIVATLGIAHALFATLDISRYGMIGVGWTLDTVNFLGGLIRMLFPFTIGILLSRSSARIKVNGAFWISAIALLILFHVPYISGKIFDTLTINGIYEFVVVACIFPILLLIGASGKTTDRITENINLFLGELSYPLYIVHYPVLYLFYAWLIKNSIYTIEDSWQVALPVYVGAVVLAWLCLKFYDRPVRKWLSKRFQ